MDCARQPTECSEFKCPYDRKKRLFVTGRSSACDNFFSFEQMKQLERKRMRKKAVKKWMKK